MNQQSLFEELAADPDAPSVSLSWEIRANSEVLLSGAISGRLRAGIVLGVRVCSDAKLREAVARTLLLRLGSRL